MAELFTVSYNVKRSLLRGFAISGITILTYLLIMIITTPNLHPPAAVNTAFSKLAYHLWYIY